jgi:hypothetical protein
MVVGSCAVHRQPRDETAHTYQEFLPDGTGESSDGIYLMERADQVDHCAADEFCPAHLNNVKCTAAHAAFSACRRSRRYSGRSRQGLSTAWRLHLRCHHEFS